MKKLLGIVVLGLLLSGNAYAQNLKFTKIINLDKPWGSSFINKDELIITEKEGKIKIVNINSREVSEVDHNLNFLKVGQGGLLDILHKDNFLWISYSEDRRNRKTSTSIAKTK